MSRRIEIELTSTRPDGSWTWRAAGAKLPKGDLSGSLLFEGAKPGDVVKADADFMLDGIEIIAVLAPKGARREPERIEVVGTPRKDDDQLVTTTLAPKQKREDRGDRRPRRDGDSAGRPRRDGDSRPPRERRPRAEGEAAGGERGAGRSERPARPARPAPETKAKPKRLRAGRVHRDAVLATLPDEHKPIADQLLRGGIPAVRAALEKQNETNRADGRPEINPAPLLALAEQIQPALRVADWRDKAEAALAGAGELDLRDLRSVVVAADDAARDEETRELATQLRAAVAARVEAEHAAWITEVTETLAAGRTVRALRVSSRPPKAGAPFPAELGSRLAAAASAALTTDTASDRYATVLDALAFSPVRSQVTPIGIPTEPTDALRTAVTKLASRLPAIAALFGIEAPTAGRSGKGKGRPASKPLPPKPAVTASTSEVVPAESAGQTVVLDAVVTDAVDVEVSESITIVSDGESTVIVDVTDVEITEVTEIITEDSDVVVIDVIEIETVETTIIEADGTETTVSETQSSEIVEVIELGDTEASASE